MKNSLLLLLFISVFCTLEADKKVEASSVEVVELKQEEFVRKVVKTYKDTTILEVIKFDPLFNELSIFTKKLKEEIRNKEDLSRRSIFIMDTLYYRLKSYRIFPPRYDFEIYEHQSSFNSQTGNYDNPVLVKVEDKTTYFILLWIFIVIYFSIAKNYFEKNKEIFWERYSSISSFIAIFISLVFFFISIPLMPFDWAFVSGFLFLLLSVFVFVFLSIPIKVLVLFGKLILLLIYIPLTRKNKVIFLFGKIGKHLFPNKEDRTYALIEKIKSVKILSEIKWKISGSASFNVKEYIDSRIKRLENDKEN